MHKNRALLLDRDGVINIDTNFVGTVDRFTFMPGLFPFLRAVRDHGYLLAVLTNQSGVARGHYTEEDHAKVTAHMVDSLHREAIAIEATFASFEHPEAPLPRYARESFWRKPNPGMVLDAARRLNLDLARSAFIGDNLRDMQAALQGGVGTCLWLTQKNPEPLPGVKIVTDYAQALTFLV